MTETSTPPPQATPEFDLSKFLEPVHRRDLELEMAAKELHEFLKPWVEKHKLTGIEYCYLLGVSYHKQIHAMCILERQHGAAK